MGDKQNHSSGIDDANFKKAFWRAVREKSPIPAIVATLFVVVIALLFLIGLLADVVTILATTYRSHTVIVSGVVIIAILVAIYLVRIYDSAVSREVYLLKESNNLENQLLLVKGHLATTEARYKDLAEFQSNLSSIYRRDSLNYFSDYLDGLRAELKNARHFRQKSDLSRDDLTTTYVQRNEKQVAVLLPIGKKDGAVKSLKYFLFRTRENQAFPTKLGTAVLDRIELNPNALLL